MPESKYDSYRFIIVGFEEKDRSTSGLNRVRRSNMSKIRRMLHDLSREHDIKLADFGTNFSLVTDEERKQVETIFKNVMQRGKDRDAEAIRLGIVRPMGTFGKGFSEDQETRD